MDKRLLSYDPITGLKTFHSYDWKSDETIISYEANSTPILELNKKLQIDADYTKQGMKGDLWHYATIPAEVQMKWLINHGVDVYKQEDGPKISKLLEDPEYRYLKTTEKHHKFK